MLASSAPACALPEEFAEGLGRDHVDPALGAKGKEIVVARDDILRPGFEGAGDNHVVLGITADVGELRQIGERRKGASQQLAERIDILVGVGITPADALVDKERSFGFGDDLLGKRKRKHSSDGLLEECIGKATRSEKGTDQRGGIKDRFRHVVF